MDIKYNMMQKEKKQKKRIENLITMYHQYVQLM